MFGEACQREQRSCEHDRMRNGPDGRNTAKPLLQATWTEGKANANTQHTYHWKTPAGGSNDPVNMTRCAVGLMAGILRPCKRHGQIGKQVPTLNTPLCEETCYHLYKRHGQT
eukprot:12276833-Alexandrium_andersonii.AAC.1